MSALDDVLSGNRGIAFIENIAGECFVIARVSRRVGRRGVSVTKTAAEAHAAVDAIENVIELKYIAAQLSRDTTSAGNRPSPSSAPDSRSGSQQGNK